MNQHNKDDILFVTPPGQPIIELRDSINKLILYTESLEVYRRFKDWKYCFYIGRYYQAHNKAVETTAYDLHFDKAARRALLKALKGGEMEGENVTA